MKFEKNVSKEAREFLAQQLDEYEKNISMTKAERRELLQWVASGHSPYENGDYICGDNGCPLDFVSALRSLNDYMEWFRNLSVEEQMAEKGLVDMEYDTQTQDISLPVFKLPNIGSDEELPFQ